MRRIHAILLLVLFVGMITSSYNIQQVNAPNGLEEYIYIRADGSIDPSDAPISTSDNITYHIDDNILIKSIIVERDNITILGHNHVIHGNQSLRVGIDLTERKNVTVREVEIAMFTFGVLLNSSDDCRLFYNTIWDNWAGIWVESSLRAIINYNNASYNNFCGIRILRGGNNEMYYNTVFSNLYGIYAWYSVADTLVGNNASSNMNNGIQLFNCGAGTRLINNNLSSNRDYGISLYESDTVRMSGNIASGNKLNFGIDGSHYLDFTTHDIDTTNLVDGKPIHYIKGESDIVYDAETNTGTIYLINCNNMTVKDLNLTKNGCGIFLWNTTESKIENISASKNYYGIHIRNSRNNTFSQNSIAENTYGMLIKNSNDSRILKCNVTSNQWGMRMDNSALNSIRGNLISSSTADGISLENSHNNTIIENSIVENAENFFPEPPIYFGVKLQNSSNNTIYHNNFIDNGGQAEAISSNSNTWDNGWPSGGNYWSDHSNLDLDGDGIAEDAYTIRLPNVDAYPLVGMFYSLETPLGYAIEIVCNSTVDEMHYYPSNNTIMLIVSNITTTQTHGFCRVKIPHDLILPPYEITVNGTLTPYSIVEENGYSIIYFTYEHSTLVIIIPELPFAILVPLLALLTTFAIMRRKGKITEI